ncbi:unnamed protein product [Rotaria sp. Silwood2]|nr:unnamed protein product [Rotaria sp. Silwood2]CAF2521535.1 unnamed protein product [Rotaria sp. Silwood2]CAF2923777.1 unnamed protein product [Rotaria sp. Silwood2]CAF3858231.1 unnamed protein product [Rotaria sp. Silwood2]CAF3893245.1 unnamed protein product [Rotaria sp. Silwood2]
MPRNVVRILTWIDQFDHADILFQGNNDSQFLIIIPNKQNSIDLRTASFSRASIDLADSILLRQGSLNYTNAGGCQFTTCSVDRHLDLLVALGGESDDSQIYHLRRD